MYIERVASIRQQRQADLVSKREKKEAKEQRERVKKEELTEKLQEIGGLWKTPDEVDRKVKALSGDTKVKNTAGTDHVSSSCFGNSKYM